MLEHVKKQLSGGEIRETKKEGNGSFAGYASTGSIDRDGDIILPSAFANTVDSFVRAGSFLAGHRTQGAEGGSLIVAKPRAARIDAKGLWVEGEFAPTPLAQEYRALVEGGFLTGMSVGFLGRTWEDTKNPDGSFGPRVFKDVELLEISLTPVPSNRDALIVARSKGVSKELCEAILKEFEPPSRHAAKAGETGDPALRGSQKILDEIQNLKSKIQNLPTIEQLEVKLYEILGDVLGNDLEKTLDDPEEERIDADKESGSDDGEGLEAVQATLAELQKTIIRIAGK